MAVVRGRATTGFARLAARRHEPRRSRRTFLPAFCAPSSHDKIGLAHLASIVASLFGPMMSSPARARANMRAGFVSVGAEVEDDEPTNPTPWRRRCSG